MLRVHTRVACINTYIHICMYAFVLLLVVCITTLVYNIRARILLEYSRPSLKVTQQRRARTKSGSCRISCPALQHQQQLREDSRQTTFSPTRSTSSAGPGASAADRRAALGKEINNVAGCCRRRCCLLTPCRPRQSLPWRCPMRSQV